MTKLSSFEDLDCYKQAVELRRNLSVVVRSFPKDEKFQLVDQIKRASRSVTANIAEGDMVVIIIKNTCNSAGKAEDHCMN